MKTQARIEIHIGITLLGVILLGVCPGAFGAETFYRYQAKENVLSEPFTLGVTANLPYLSAPTAADLAETPDVRFTDELQFIANALGSDPVNLYNYVHDYIEFDIYYGSLKGSQGCLAEAAGNDFDQASLLIALLRYHGYPARYQYGTLRLTLDQAQQLSMTNVNVISEGYQAINRSLSSQGYPAVMQLGGQGQPLFLDIDLCWVRAYVPSTNYRGRPGGESASDWMYLFPAFKWHEYDEPQVNLAGKVLFDPIDYFLNAPLDVLPLDYYLGNVATYIKNQGIACPTLGAAMFRRRIRREQLEVLPASLPAPIITNPYNPPATWSEIPASFRHKMRIRAEYTDSYGWSWDDFQATVNMPQVYGKKIAVEWPGAGKVDQEAIDAVGGLENLPPLAIVNVSARLVLDDTTNLANGSSLTPGTDMNLHVLQEYPNYPGYGLPIGSRQARTGVGVQNEYQMSAGGAAVIATCPQRVPDSVFAYHVERLDQLKTQGASNSRIRTQELFLIALSYLRQYKDGNDLVGGLHRWNFNHIWHAIEAVDLWFPPSFPWPGSPGAGTQVDFTSVASPHPITGDFSLEFEVFEMSGHQGSGLEFGVLQQYLNQTCVAYVNLMQRSVRQQGGIDELVTVTQANVNTFHTELVNIPSSSITKIRNHVNSNPAQHIARVPKRQLQVNQYRGFGYFLGNAVDGTGQYLISGGYQ